MLVVNDAMVLIHLAKTTLLGMSCDYFGTMAIPKLVYDEVSHGDHLDYGAIAGLVEQGKISVRPLKDMALVSKAHEFNIQRGEAEAVALYWELSADLLATDDNNVRKKREVLQINIIGTPAIVLQLYRRKKISKDKLSDVIRKLKEVGWFSSTVWDKVTMEVDKNA